MVEQTLAGRGDRLKAYDLAVAVLGRDDGFDPQNDPIVRIEFARLRRDLEHYYLTDGRDDPIRITIPKGHYVPGVRGAGAEPRRRSKAEPAARDCLAPRLAAPARGRRPGRASLLCRRRLASGRRGAAAARRNWPGRP